MPQIPKMRRTQALAWIVLAGFAAGRAPAQLTDLGAIVVDACDAPADCLTNEFFGAALAACDFDDDGFEDLAVGVPSETVGPNDRAGSIHVFRGSPGGLLLTGPFLLDLDDLDLSGGADVGDRFGETLAAGDFDRDGICDLAVGAPTKSVGAPGNAAGAVVVLFGVEGTGLSGENFLFLSQNHLPPGSSESAEELDGFGKSLAALPNGGLAVGVPSEDSGIANSDGKVQLFSTSAPGSPLDSVTDRTQDNFISSCSDGNEVLDHWGMSLVVGKFGNAPSLVVGAPDEHVGSVADSGRVTVIGSPVACFDQDTPGVVETAEDSDQFGAALAAADFDGDGFDDLAIGVPFEDFESTPDGRAGAVQVLFGSSLGLTANGNFFFAQDNFPGGQGPADLDDHFGTTLATGDFDADGFYDLAIGVPHEEIGGAQLAGMFHARYGSLAGFDTNADQTFHSNLPAGMPDSPNPGDQFGYALATGDFDGNGTDDLAVGMPGESLGSATSAGAVTVVYGLDGETGAFGTVAFADASDTISEAGGTQLVVVTRSGGAPIAASVSRNRTGGSAIPGVDFENEPGQEFWAIGDIGPEFFPVQIVNDTIDEPNETVVFSLSNVPQGVAIASPSTFTLTIADDDVAGALSFVQPVSVVLENAGSVDVVVGRTGGAASAVTVEYHTANGTASAGSDYVVTSGTLTWGAGETSKIVTVPIVDDPLAERPEQFVVQLLLPGGGGTLGTFTTHQIVIVDEAALFLDGFDSGSTSAWSAVTP